MTKNIQHIMDWYRQFNKSDILIKSKTHEFEIGINDRQLPHLLGLHYVSRSYLRGSKLYNHVKRLSDEEIFKRIEENHPDKLNMVKDRVQYFRYFMENLENAYLYEQSHSGSKIKSDFLLVDMEDGSYLHLGIGNNGLEDYLETFIVHHDDTYVKESQIKEQVEGLYRLDELMIPVPFSFDLEKNRILEEERRQRLEEVYQTVDWRVNKLENAIELVELNSDGEYVDVVGLINPSLYSTSEELMRHIQESYPNKIIRVAYDGADFISRYGEMIPFEQAFNKDTDKDGLVDTLEQSLGTNPYGVDSDADGRTDIEEFSKGTDPKRPDKKQELEDVIALAIKEAQAEDNYKAMNSINNEREL